MKKNVYQRDRDRFLMRKYLIRSIIAGYFDASPTDVRILKTPAGKPLFDGFGDAIRTHRLELSISHSHDCTLLAIATWAPIGIDIEFVDQNIDPDILLQFFCSNREQEWCKRDRDRLSRFLRLWTAKEACLKLSGTGLSVDPREIECHPEKPEGFFVEWKDGSFGPCRVIPIPVGKNYVASLAILPGYSTFRMQSDTSTFDLE